MNSFFQNNRIQLMKQLEIGDVAILFAGKAPKSTADAHYNFMQNKNFYYMSGCTEEHFILGISKTETGIVSTLFIEKPDYDVEKWVGRKTKQEDAKEKSGVDQVAYLDTFNSWLSKKIYNNEMQRLFLDLEKLTWDEGDSEASLFSKEFQKRFSYVPIKTLHPILSALRTIKSTYEISQIKKAVELTHKGLDAILHFLKPGVYEYQIEATFAHAIRMNGADGNSFPTIAASGEDAVILHYVENNKQVEEGKLVLIDLGAQYHQYAADITRTYPVSGRFSERQKTLYNIVLKAQEAVIAAIKPGALLEDLNKICQASLTEDLMHIGLINEESELGKYYYHGVTHHLGLDVHDIGPRSGEIKPGMVLTVEPGLYIQEEGIGIRIEEDVLVTESGNEVLSAAIPKTVEEIESLMG